MEPTMDELGWELLKTYFATSEIDVELFQESVGPHVYPVTVDGLGRVQLFVSKEQAQAAQDLLDQYKKGK